MFLEALVRVSLPFNIQLLKKVLALTFIVSSKRVLNLGRTVHFFPAQYLPSFLRYQVTNFHYINIVSTNLDKSKISINVLSEYAKVTLKLDKIFKSAFIVIPNTRI